MKRWLAGLLSVMILLCGSICLAQEPDDRENADIQETVVSVEGESLGSLSENLRFLKEMMNDPDVRELLANEEVKNVSSEIIWRVLVWMYRNRPVTMKILAELGVGENDIRCVEKIWDSAERIGKALEEHSKTEDGKQLQAEAAAVKNDPDLQQSLTDFEELASSDELGSLLDALKETAEEGHKAAEKPDGSLSREAIDRQMDRSSFTGRLLLRIFSVMDNSEWAKKSLPKLLKNENLWRFLLHLSSGNKELDQVIRDECALIAGDPEMNDFIKETLKELHALRLALQGPEKNGTEKTDKEAAP